MPKLPPQLPALAPGWDYTENRDALPLATEPGGPSLRTRILSLFADPRVESVTIEATSRALECPRQDIETVFAAMCQAGELEIDNRDVIASYGVSEATKRELEALFKTTAERVGERSLVTPAITEPLATYDDELEEPRLPVTAGLLSLFLPGTGQLLNGDVGRASLVFAVWSLAWITHLSPVWTFVCLYAGAEAFFTAKIRSMERKLAKEALAAGAAGPQSLPPPRPSST